MDTTATSQASTSNVTRVRVTTTVWAADRSAQAPQHPTITA
jgi:hypothetical protein